LTPVITIVGPEHAKWFLENLAAAMAGAGQPVRCSASGDLLSLPGVSETEILVSLMVPCGAREMDAMPRLRGIVSPILGYDWIDVAEATRRGIPVVNGEAPENRESMAEATIMLLLVLLYRLHDTQAQMRVADPGPAPRRRMLKGRTIGIIGSGGIARQIIRRLAPWEADLQVHTRVASPDLPGVRLVELDQLLCTSDVVIVMTSLDAGSRHLLDAQRLRLLKRGALLINTARGGLIEEASLVEALRSGHIGAAALDVFDVEPLPASHPLRELPNVILTPHAVGHTVELHEAIARTAVNNVLQLSRGMLPDSCRNREIEKHWMEQ
jgi:D-3-phosphoglycerate dehydrogenase / 2-oxoglutarate reductase